MHRTRAIVFFFICFFSSYVFADVSTDIPLENPIYNNIDRLSDLGIFRDDVQTFRPITLDHLETMLNSIDPNQTHNPTITRDIQTLKNFLDAEYKKNVVKTDFEITFLKSNAIGTPNLETDSFSNPLLNTKDQGRFESQSNSLRFQPRLTFEWEGWSAFDLRPVFSIEDDGPTDTTHPNTELRTAQYKIGHGDLELAVGRMPIQWGYAFTGGLIFGGSQKPLDMIQIRNSSPIVPPSFLKFLGPTQFSGFVARLDDDQILGGSLIIGERGVIKPFPFLEMGFTQSIQLAGNGAPNLSFVDVLSEVIGKRLQDINSVNLTNRNISLDLLVKIPPWKNLTIYTEMYFEDCCKYTFTRDASKLVGIKLPDLWESAGSLALEYVLTTEIYNRHGRYLSGFVNQGYPLGHMVGPDAQGLYMKYHHVTQRGLEIDLINAYEMRGRNELNQKSDDIRLTFPTFEKPEERIRSTIKFQKNWKGKQWSSLQTGYERVWNSQFQDDQNRDHFLVRFDQGFSF